MYAPNPIKGWAQTFSGSSEKTQPDNEGSGQKRGIEVVRCKSDLPHLRQFVGKPITSCSKNGGTTVIRTENNALFPSRIVIGWRICIDYRKLNKATKKDHFLLPFLDQMLDWLVRHEYYCFLDRYSSYNQITISLEDQEKTTSTFPYGTFAFRGMPFGLCNAPNTFQRCMMAIFLNMIEKTMEVFMDDISVLGNSLENRLENLRQALIRCEEINLVLNWEKCHFMVKEGIVLEHQISERGIKVDKAKFDTIEKLPSPSSMKVIRSFLGHEILQEIHKGFLHNSQAPVKSACSRSAF